jgi:hypothetical protein
MNAKTLLLLIAAITLAMVNPAARAHDKNPWDAPDRILHQLYGRMDAVNAKRDRWGANPRMQDEIAQLRFGIGDLTERVKHQAGDPTVARKKADDLSDLMSHVEAEYRDRAHHTGVEIHVDRGW